jgi:hypothetical protein
MLYFLDEIKVNLSTYNVDEDLYKHKFKTYAYSFFQFTYMTFHRNSKSLQNVGSLTIVKPSPSHQFVDVKEPKPSPRELQGGAHFESL